MEAALEALSLQDTNSDSVVSQMLRGHRVLQFNGPLLYLCQYWGHLPPDKFFYIFEFTVDIDEEGGNAHPYVMLTKAFLNHTTGEINHTIQIYCTYPSMDIEEIAIQNYRSQCLEKYYAGANLQCLINDIDPHMLQWTSAIDLWAGHPLYILTDQALPS